MNSEGTSMPARVQDQEVLRRQNERLALLAEAAAHLLATANPRDQMEGLFERVAVHLGVDTCFGFTLTPEGDALKLDFCRGVPPEVLPDLQRLDLGQAICGTAAQTLQPVHACRIQSNTWQKAALVRSLGIRAYCCHPLMAGDHLLGTLSFASRTRDAFEPDEVGFMGTICHYVAMAKERARLYEEARQRTAQLEAVMDAAPGVIFIAHDPDCRHITGSKASYEILRMRPPGNISLSAPEGERPDHFRVVHQGRELEPHELPIQRAARGETVRDFEETVAFRDGTSVTLYGNAVPLRDAGGRPAGAVGVFADVTELRRQAEALRKSEAQIRLSADNAPAYLCYLDTDYRYRFANVAYAQRFGRMPHELLGRTVPEVAGQAAFNVVRAQMERALRGETAAFEAEIPYEQLGRRYMQVVYAPDTAEDGTVRGLFCVIHDLTARRAAEEERAGHLREIATLNERLQRAIQETHHRVKNNLQVIAGMIDLQILEPGSHVEKGELLRIATHVRTLAVVHDLLTQEATGDSHAESVPARQMLERLLELVRQTNRHRRFRVDIQDLRLTSRQATSLALVVNEVVSNAVKHGRGVISVSLEVEGTEARLRVVDQGDGFPPNFRVQEMGSTGLSLVDHLSRWDLGGTAHFTTQPAGGAEVVICMPLQQDPLDVSTPEVRSGA